MRYPCVIRRTDGAEGVLKERITCRHRFTHDPNHRLIVNAPNKDARERFEKKGQRVLKGINALFDVFRHNNPRKMKERHGTARAAVLTKVI